MTILRITTLKEGFIQIMKRPDDVGPFGFSTWSRASDVNTYWPDSYKNS